MNKNKNDNNHSICSISNQSTNNYSKEQYLYLIYLSDKCKRYEDALLAFEDMIQTFPSNLNKDEQEMFENCIKCIIKNKQKNLNKICNFIKEVKKNKTDDNENNILILNSLYEEKSFIENEINELCNKVIKIIDSFLIKHLNSRSDLNINPYTEKEYEVFLLRMKGDLYKYLSQVVNQEEYQSYLKRANEYFSKALEIGKKHLDGINKTFLETVIVYAKFVQDFLKESDSSLNILLSVYNLNKVKEILNGDEKEIEETDPAVINLLNNLKNMIIALQD